MPQNLFSQKVVRKALILGVSVLFALGGGLKKIVALNWLYLTFLANIRVWGYLIGPEGVERMCATSPLPCPPCRQIVSGNTVI